MSDTTATTTNAKPKAPKTASTAFLERIREREGYSVAQYLQEMVNFHNNEETPSTSYQELITNYANSMKKRGTGNGGSKEDPIKGYIQQMFEQNLTSVQGIFVSAQNSRIHKTEGIYAVKLKTPAGTENIIYIDTRNLSDVKLMMKGDFQIGNADISSLATSSSEATGEGETSEATNTNEENNDSESATLGSDTTVPAGSFDL